MNAGASGAGVVERRWIGRTTREALPIPPLTSKARIPVPAPTTPSGDSPTGRAAGVVEGRPDVGLVDLDRDRPVEVAVVALGHDRHDRVAEGAVRGAVGASAATAPS